VRIRRYLPVAIVVLLGVIVALALAKQFQSRPATPSPVPTGDYEIAWINTTTNPQTWERLVAAVFQIRREFPAVQVDDSRAFLDQTAAVPEVVLSVPGRQDKIRLRWYKLSSEVGNREWVRALATRNPPPLAFMGGGSSDRAIELAQALNEQTEWKGGTRPLLFITTATANTVADPVTDHPVSLIQLYPKRTFRGCFTNEAMARAVVDFVWQARKDLRPGPLGESGGPDHPAARAYVMAWQDDPYSVDLADQFVARIQEQDSKEVKVHPLLDRIAYSVGTFTDPNPPEREVMDRILPDIASHPNDRALLVLPAVTQPARRIIRAFAADSPLIGQRLVAVTGDGVSFNMLYRDGDVAWPVQELSVPLVFFAHQNPVAWTTGDGPADTASLHPPTATDDVLLFADIIRLIAKAVYMGEKVTDADKLAAKLRAADPPFFTPDGERRTGEGEYIVVLRPQFGEGGRVSPQAAYEVYTRQKGQWKLERKLIKKEADEVVR
jgi:hypothetical protein